MKLTRYAYINTKSQAGEPEKVEFEPKQVNHAYVWSNSFGNPTYTLYLDDGRRLLCVDDYGAMNGIDHITARRVSRRKDLF